MTYLDVTSVESGFEPLFEFRVSFDLVTLFELVDADRGRSYLGG